MLEKAGREFTCAISLLMPQNMKSDVSPLEEGKKLNLGLNRCEIQYKAYHSRSRSQAEPDNPCSHHNRHNLSLRRP